MDLINYAKIKKISSELSNLQTEKADKLKVASIEKDLNDYQKTLSQVNINQEAKQSVTGYGVVSLPKNAANGQVSVSLKGRSLKNELNYNRDTWAEWTKSAGVVGDSTGLEWTANGTNLTSLINSNFKNSTKYGLIYNVVSGNLDNNFTIVSGDGTIVTATVVSKTIGNNKFTFTTGVITDQRIGFRTNVGNTIGTKIKVQGIRIFELPVGSEIENDFNTMTAEQLAIKYPYIKGDGTKSTISASRLKSVGKNMWNGELEFGDINSITGINVSSSTRIRTKNYIEVESSKTYTLSNDLAYSPVIFQYDKDKNFIKYVAISTFTTEPNAKYILVRFGTDQLNLKLRVQLEKGTVATPYEPYTESNQYITAKDSNGNIVELRSLPNGTNDEIRTSEGKLIKRVSDEFVLNGNFAWESSLAGTNTYSYKLPNNTLNNIESSYFSEQNSDGAYSYANSAVDIRALRFLVNGTVRVIIEKSKIDAMVGADVLTKFKEYLNKYPITLTYQLATPIETPIDVSGTLMSYPSGTIWIENAVADAGIYTDKFTVLQQDLPIKEIEKISKVDFTTGIETELDVSQAVISTDKLSFTHPSLTENDIVFTTYFYDLESTQGELTVEYYDSRYVLKDSVTGKYYKVVPTVANGVLSNTLVEV